MLWVLLVNIWVLGHQCTGGMMLRNIQRTRVWQSQYNLQKAVPIQNIEINDAENFVLTFGKHNGEKLGEVDTGYLEWLAENANDKAVGNMAKEVLQARLDSHKYPPETAMQEFSVDDGELPF